MNSTIISFSKFDFAATEWRYTFMSINVVHDKFVAAQQARSCAGRQG